MQIVVNHTLTHYEDINPDAKKIILFLHGWANNSSQWLPIAQKLPPEYRYILLDLPGFGQTQFLPEGANVPEYAEFVIDFIEKLNLKNVSLFGHSFGGQIALLIASDNKTPLHSLILLSPAGIRLKDQHVKLKIALVKILKRFRPFTPPFFQNILLNRLASDDYTASFGQHRDILNNIVNYDLSAQIKNVKVPTHLLWGDQDKVIPYLGKYIAQTIPNCELIILYGAGHLPHLFQSEKLIASLSEVLNRL